MHRSRSRSPASARRPRVSYEQVEALLEYVELNRELATGYFNSTAGRRTATRHWEQVALNLNAIGGGAIKDAKGWSAYWSDYKNKLKKKQRTMQQAITGTGGGRPRTQTLSELDLRFLRVLGHNFGQALQGVRVNPDLETEAEHEEQAVGLDDDFVAELDGVFSEPLSLPQLESASILDHNYLVVSSPVASTPGTVLRPLTATSPPALARVAVVAPPERSPQLHSAQNRPRTRRRRCSPLPSTLDTARAAVTNIERQRLEQERQHVRTMADTATATSRLATAVEAMVASQREQAGAMCAVAAAMQAAAAALTKAADIYEAVNRLQED